VDYHLHDCGASIVLTDGSASHVSQGGPGAFVVAGEDGGLEGLLAAHRVCLAWWTGARRTSRGIGYTSGTPAAQGRDELSPRADGQAITTWPTCTLETGTHHARRAALPGSGYNAIAYTMKACTQVIHQRWGSIRRCSASRWSATGSPHVPCPPRST